MRVSFNTGTPGLLALVRGNQLVAEKRLEEAKVELEKAIASGGPTVAEARARLAWISIQTGESARGLELLTPLEQEFPDRYEVVAGLGLGYSREGDCQRGISYLERAMTLRPPDTVVLNVAGDCYMTLGNDQKAAETFKRSLNLDPEQPRVKEVLSSIQGNNH
jgi:Flp pilus assembly protein TadD